MDVVLTEPCSIIGHCELSLSTMVSVLAKGERCTPTTVLISLESQLCGSLFHGTITWMIFDTPVPCGPEGNEKTA